MWMRLLSVQTPLVWNSLPPHIQHSSSLSQFKTSLKTFLFTSAFSELPWFPGRFEVTPPPSPIDCWRLYVADLSVRARVTDRRRDAGRGRGARGDWRRKWLYNVKLVVCLIFGPWPFICPSPPFSFLFLSFLTSLICLFARFYLNMKCAQFNLKWTALWAPRMLLTEGISAVDFFSLQLRFSINSKSTQEFLIFPENSDSRSYHLWFKAPTPKYTSA